MFFKVMLLLGFSIHFLAHTRAQVVEEKKTVSKMRIKMVKEVDGKRVVIDTTIENATQFDLDAYMKSRGIDHPAGGKEEDSRDMLIIRHKSGHGDSTMIHDEEILNLPGGDHKKIIIKKLDWKEGEDENHPAPVIPDEVLKDEKKLRAYLEQDTFFKNAVIIDGKELKITEERDVDVQTDEKGARKEIKIMVIKRVSIEKLTDEEKKTRKTESGAAELKVERIDFYPNPNNGRFNLSFELKEKGTTAIEITNKNGQPVYSEKLKNFSGKFSKEMDLSSEEKGIYYLTVKQGKNVLMRKLLIE